MDINLRLEQGWLHLRTIIEMLGKPKEHVVLYSPDTFAKIAKEAGLRRRMVELYNDPVPGEFEYQTKFEWRQIFTK